MMYVLRHGIAARGFANDRCEVLAREGDVSGPHDLAHAGSRDCEDVRVFHEGIEILAEHFFDVYVDAREELRVLRENEIR